MAYQPKAEGKCDVSSDGSAWHRLLNVTGLTFSGGDRPENTNETLDEGSIVSVGAPVPKDVSVTLQANPASQGYRLAFDAYKDQEKLQFRYRTDASLIIDNADTSDELEIAAAAAGAQADLTATSLDLQTNSNFQVGRGIVIGGELYVLEEINSATAGKVSRADGAAISAVAATDAWEVWEFGVQYQFEVEVLNAGNPDLSPGSPYSDTLTLKSTAILADPTFIFTV